MSTLRRNWDSPNLLPDMIISDLDGTLTRTSKMAARLASIGDKWDLPISKSALWMLKMGHKAYKALGEEFDKTCDLKQKVLKKLGAEQEDSVFLFAAAIDNHIPCVILSNGPKDWGQMVLKQLGLKFCFEQAVFREDTPYLKPDPRSLKPILDKNGGTLPEKARIWMFGDRQSDVILAHNANGMGKHHYVPVAVEGSEAANMIHQMNAGGRSLGVVFRNQYEMGCHISPTMRNPQLPFIIPEYVDSISPT